VTERTGTLPFVATALALAMAAACPTYAQLAPVASGEDSRIAILRYAPGMPAQLRAIAGVELTVLMPHGEHVQRVTVGDPSAVRVEVPGDHDGIVVSALHPLNDVSLSVETDRQTYEFSVSVSYQGTVPWLVRVERGGGIARGMFPTMPLSTMPPANPLPSSEWKLKGDKSLEPTMIRDDGAKVSIQWSNSQAIPAVFALDAQGQEQMVNGYMRGDVFVIDRVFDHLVFRIDKAMSRADRNEPKAKK
jgi:type IV secretion system protein VirB9